MSPFTERAVRMAQRNGLEPTIKGAGVEMVIGGNKIFVTPASRPCRVHIEGAGQSPMTQVEWQVLEMVCRQLRNNNE